MQEYDIDNFGWPHKKIKSQHLSYYIIKKLF